MAKISQARKAMAAADGGRKRGSTAKGNLAVGVGQSDRPAEDSGVDMDSIEAAFAPPADESQDKPKPTKRARKSAPAQVSTADVPTSK